MNLLHRLAEPAFAKDSVLRPSARTLGFVIATCSVLLLIGTLGDLRAQLPRGWNDPIKPLWTAVGAFLPQLLAALGGMRMFRGDMRGKRLVVLAIPLSFVYAVRLLMQVAGGSGEGDLEVFFGIPMLLVYYAFFYYLVVTSQVGQDPRTGRQALSTWVMAFVIYFVALTASGPLGFGV